MSKSWLVLPLMFRFLLIAGIASTLAYCGRHLAIDDSFIYARYIQNALHGYGLVFNAGEHVNALTSPLYCYLLLALCKVTGIGVLIVGRIIFFSGLIAASFLAEYFIAYAGLLVAACPYFYMLEGMETTLFLSLLMLAVVAFKQGRWNLLPTLYMLILLTRFEGGLLGAAFLGAQILRHHGPRLLAFVPPAIIAGLYCFLNFKLYGRLLPNSATAKFGQGTSGYFGKWPFAFLHPYGLLHIGQIGSILALVPLILLAAFYGVKRAANQKEEWLTPLGIFLLGLLLFYLVFNIPDYHWYYAPFVFFLLLLSANAVSKNVRGALVVAAVVSIMVVQGVRHLTPLGPVAPYERLAAWMNEHSAANATLATADIGVIGWNLPTHHIYDMVGLTEPKNSIHTAKRQPAAWLAEDRPDYAVVHDKPMVWELGVVESPQYRPLPADFGDVKLYVRQGVAPH